MTWRTLAPVTAVLLGFLLGCTPDRTPDATPVHVPGASTSSAAPQATKRESQATPTTPIVTTGPVIVSTRLKVPRDPTTEAFAAFVEAHARSVIAGVAIPALREVTSPAEYARQVRVITDARDRGLTVPTRPRIVVVEARRPDPRQAELGVCLYLPSTEFVDQITGVSPAGPVPATWVPAVATLSRETVTWVVDKLGQPDRHFAPECRGLS